MTRDEIERLEGRELDYWVSRRVFGETQDWHEEHPGLGLCEGCFPRWSWFLDRAWQVAQRMAELGYGLDIFELSLPAGHPDKPTCSLAFGKDRVELGTNRYTDSDIARAICRAALIALASEEAERNADA